MRGFCGPYAGWRRTMHRGNSRTCRQWSYHRNAQYAYDTAYYSQSRNTVRFNSSFYPGFRRSQRGRRPARGHVFGNQLEKMDFSTRMNIRSEQIDENRKRLTELDIFQPRISVLPEQLHSEEMYKFFMPPLRQRDIVFQLLVCDEGSQHETIRGIDDYLKTISAEKRHEIEISSKSIIGYALSQECAARRAAVAIAYLKKAMHDVFEFSRILEWLDYALPCRCKPARMTEIQIMNLATFLLELNKLFQGKQQAKQMHNYITEMSRYFLLHQDCINKPQVKALLEVARSSLMAEDEKIKNIICMELQSINVPTFNNDAPRRHYFPQRRAYGQRWGGYRFRRWDGRRGRNY